MAKLAQYGKYFTFAICLPPFLVLFMLLHVANVLMQRLNLYMMLAPVVLLSTLLVGAGWVLWLVRKVLQRRWGDVMALVAAPLTALLVITWLGAVGFTPSWIRFQILRAQYEAQIAVSTAVSPKLAAFDWTDTGEADTANTSNTLIYDESDEIGLSPPRRSQRWLERAARIANRDSMASVLQEESDVRSVSVKRLGGHFYLVSQTYH